MLGAIGHLEQDDRRALYRLKVRLGPLDVFIPDIAEARRAILARGAARGAQSASRCPRCPPAGAATVRRRRPTRAAPRSPSAGSARRWLRIDLADRLASHARKARSDAGSDPLDRALATSLGLDEEAIGRLMAEIGFVRSGDELALARPALGPQRRDAAAAPRATSSPRSPSSSGGADPLRIDRFLFFIRLAKSRTLAQAIVDAGHVRIDGKRVAKPSEEVRAGSIVALPLRGEVRVLRVLALPGAPRPAAEARAATRSER